MGALDDLEAEYTMDETFGPHSKRHKDQPIISHGRNLFSMVCQKRGANLKTSKNIQKHRQHPKTLPTSKNIPNIQKHPQNPKHPQHQHSGGIFFQRFAPQSEKYFQADQIFALWYCISGLFHLLCCIARVIQRRTNFEWAPSEEKENPCKIPPNQKGSIFQTKLTMSWVKTLCWMISWWTVSFSRYFGFSSFYLIKLFFGKVMILSRRGLIDMPVDP